MNPGWTTAQAGYGSCLVLTMHSFRRKKEQRIWIDYTSLRQNQNDFKAEEVIILVKEIQHFAASYDPDLEYTRRSFCVLEMYAAVAE